MALIETLIDNFNDDSMDTGKWYTFITDASSGTVEEKDRRVVITPFTGVSGKELYWSGLNHYDFTGSSAFVQIVKPVTASTGSVETLYSIRTNTPSDEFGFAINISNQLRAYVNSVGNIATTTWDSYSMSFLRVRESGGTMYWDYSADGATWTNWTSRATLAGVTDIQPYLWVFYSSALTGISPAIFDNFNVKKTNVKGPHLTGILDEFDRPNAAPGSDWGQAVISYSLPNIVSNQLDWPTFPSGYWAASTFAANQEVFAKGVDTGAGLPEVGFLLRFANPNTGTESGYEVEAISEGLGWAEAFRWDAGARTSLGYSNFIVPTGDVYLAASIVDSTITLYSGTDGITWTSRQTWTDTTYNRTGYIGLYAVNNGQAGALDNFGGGTIQSVATTAWFKA